MKTLIALLILATSLLSCTKESAPPPVCYNCQFGQVAGYQRPPEVYCGEMPHNFQDAQGNDVSYMCQPR